MTTVNTDAISSDDKLRILKLMLSGLTYVQAMRVLGIVTR
jgi:hypothetical protein